MAPYQDEPLSAQPNDGDAARRARVVRIPVVEVGDGDQQQAAPTELGQTRVPVKHAQPTDDSELQRLRRNYAMLQRQLKAREEDLSKANKSIGTLSRVKRDLDERLAKAQARTTGLEGQVSTLNAQLNTYRTRLDHANARLHALEERNEELVGTVEDREATIQELTEERSRLQGAIGDRDATIALKQQVLAQRQQEYNRLYETHTTLLKNLEEHTDQYTKRKELVLRQQVQDSLAQWSRHCQEAEPAAASHDQSMLANKVNEEMRQSMVDVTNAFQRDLADIRMAMESLEATRNALRKDLDLWQQGLFTSSYERLARGIQSLEVEIWRTMETRLTLAASDDAQASDDALASWDELIDHLQILSENLKSATECFGLRYFRAQEGDAIDAIRHQAYGTATPAPESGATVAACVSAGVEVRTADGEMALLRPALVTLATQ